MEPNSETSVPLTTPCCVLAASEPLDDRYFCLERPDIKTLGFTSAYPGKSKKYYVIAKTRVQRQRLTCDAGL